MKKLLVITVMIFGLLVGCVNTEIVETIASCEGIREATFYEISATEQTMIQFVHDGNCCNKSAGFYSYDYRMYQEGFRGN